MLNFGSRIVNNWIYEIEDGYVLVDTGYETGYLRLKERLSQHHIELQHIRYIFLTHAHDDHAGFLNEILDEVSTVQVVMSEKAPAVLFRGQNSFEGGCTSRLALFFCNVMKLFGKGAHLFPPLNPNFADRCILLTEDNRTEAERRLHGRIIDTPGHTADSISLLLDNGSLFCGDAAMNGFPSLNKITIWAEDQNEYLQSWETIIAARPEKIYPGHGRPFAYTELSSHLENVRNMVLRPLDGAK